MIIDNEEYKDLTEYINDKTRQNMNSITYVGRIIAILFVIELASIVAFFILVFTKFKQIMTTRFIIAFLLITALSILTYLVFIFIINSIERNNQMIEVLHKINEKEKNTK